MLNFKFHDLLFVVFFSDKPLAPRNLQVAEIYKDFITVQWEAPEQDGGSPITKYIIEKADAKRAVFSAIGETDSSTLKFKATKLYEGSQYLFRVIAENAIGQSEPVTLKEPVTAKLQFG